MYDDEPPELVGSEEGWLMLNVGGERRIDVIYCWIGDRESGWFVSRISLFLHECSEKLPELSRPSYFDQAGATINTTKTKKHAVTLQAKVAHLRQQWSGLKRCPNSMQRCN